MILKFVSSVTTLGYIAILLYFHDLENQAVPEDYQELENHVVPRQSVIFCGHTEKIYTNFLEELTCS